MKLISAVLFVIWLMVCQLSAAHATVNSSTNKTIALGNGTQTVFTFNFIGVSSAYITVILTAADGTETVLTQGSGTTQYQLTLNAPVQGAIWGAGGVVTFNPSGTPIPAGSTLTIFRTLPLTQAITLQNMASIATLGKGAETGLDTGVMQGQQINEQISRALQMNITNTVPPNQLPPAAQLANQGLCGDGTGNNIIACSLAPAGVISSAMAPVVGAATLSAGRTALGLGSMATENINGGSCGGPSIQDDGAGNARVVPAVVADSTNQSVSCNFHLNTRAATASLTYTLGKASSTYFNGFAFTIEAVNGFVTVTPNAADNFFGAASGASISIPQGTSCQITTNAASTAVWYLACNSTQPAIAVNASGNALAIAVLVPQIGFRNTTLGSGSSLWGTATTAMSITIPSGATLGTTNSIPFRVWIFATYNSGTPLLGVATCSAPGAIYPCSSWETFLKTGIGITAGATSAGTLYTATGTASDVVRILGYVDYASGLATAGTWNSNPTTTQVCVPPFVCKRPGDVIQSQQAGGVSVAISPSASPNLVKFSGALTLTANNTTANILYKRGATTLFTSETGVASATIQVGNSAVLLDAPGTTTSTTYTIAPSGGTPGNATTLVEEIMG